MNTNNGGITNIDVLSVGALYINGRRFRDVVTELVGNITLNAEQIAIIQTFLNRVDISGLTGNWVVDDTNKNTILKQLIDALNTKTNYLDTTALTTSWVLDNTNKNSVLKSSIDGINSSVGTLNTKTQYITSQTGNNTTNPKLKSAFAVEVQDRDETQIHLQTSAINYVSVNSNVSDNTLNNVTIASATGTVLLSSKNIKLNPFNGGDTIEIGKYGSSNTGNIKIGGSLSKIDIGSVEDPIFATTPGALGYNDNTIITIGKRAALKNTLTYLNGNINTGDSRFTSLTVTDVVTWETLASWLAGFTLSNAPYWLAYFAISGTPNYRYSDVIKMANNYLTGGLTKNNSIETSNDLGLKKLTVIDTSVISLSTAFDALLQRLCFQAFAVHGSHSIGSIWGQTDIYAGSGNVIMRCDGGAIDWAFKNAGNTNYVKVSNLDTEVVQCNGSGGNGTLKLGAFNGNIDMYVGTAGTQASGTKVIQVKSTKQVIIGDNNTQANRYDATSKVIIDHTNLANGLKVCKASGQTARMDHNNISCQSFTFQDDYDIIGNNNVFEKTLYTTQNGAKLFYWGEQIYPPLNTQTTVGGGITYLINNPTTVTNASPAPTITMTAAYTSATTTSIIRTGYTVGLNHLLTTIKSEYIPSLGNSILSGVYEANLWATYTGNSPANLKAKLFYVAETTDITGFSLINKNYTGSAGSGTLQAIKTKVINVPQTVFQGFFGNITGFLSIDLLNVVFPSVTVTTAGTVTLTCTLKNNSGSVLYTFQSISGATSGTSNRFFLCVTSPTPATITAESLTNFFFEIAITSGTGTISQASARNANDANYTFNGRVRYLLYDGTFNPTSLTQNSTNLYALSLPVETCDTTEFTTFSKIQTEIYFSQVSGNNNNHQIALLFNDGNLSHMHTNITPAGGAGNPTLASVLATSNSAGANEINMNGNLIRGISALIPVSGSSWLVRNLSAGSGISISNDGAGIYTISHSFPEPACVLWFSGQQNQTTNLYPIVDFTSVGKIDLNNYNIEYEIDITWNRQPAGYNGTFMLLGLNTHINTTYDVNNASTTWDRAIENGGNVSVFDQTFRRRFFCGFNGSHGSGNNFRYRTLLKGTLCMFRRTTGQATNLDSYPDPITSTSRVVNNRFYCDNMVNQILSTNSSVFFESGTNDFSSGQSTINGSANWEMHYDNVWNIGLSNAPVNGIYSLVFYLFDLFNTAQNRSFNANFKIWRVKKV